jgi:hypothetical protein
MLAHKRRNGLAVLLFLGMVAFGTKVFPWRTQAVETQETCQKDTRNDSDPGAERAKPGDKEPLQLHHCFYRR